ncbi:uncharacterized protein M6B38_346560 [Iris pallida]|uniref:Secreted protein n=1 Tax=Iris pallida TaxID=29817 RepID=A0AAX6GUE5_IRIPA|nr:uncharacterized protein M6B38_346560 [Iris pallida]
MIQLSLRTMVMSWLVVMRPCLSLKASAFFLQSQIISPFLIAQVFGKKGFLCLSIYVNQEICLLLCPVFPQNIRYMKFLMLVDLYLLVSWSV